MKLTSRDLVSGLIGAGMMLCVLGLFAPNLVKGTYNTMTLSLGIQKPAPVPERVRSVVSEWSGSTTFADSDQLSDIWNQTLNSAKHDYPFDQGGSDGLARQLNTEFKHVPKADQTLTAENFEPNGNLKSVAQLISFFSAHVH